MTSQEFKKLYTYKQLEAYNSEIRSRYNNLSLRYNQLVKKQDVLIESAVKQRTKELENKHKQEIQEKDKEINALKKEIAKLHSIMDNNTSNSGIPTSKTKIGEKKYIPNSREKSNKTVGGQLGHKKHKLLRFNEEEATEVVEVSPKLCPKCGSNKIEIEKESIDKCETDYEVKVIKRLYKFKDCKCKNCGSHFHTPIPNNLKEDNQYGSTVKSLAVCLNNEIYTPFNKVVKLVEGITNGEIKLSEGYVAKLQKQASDNLDEYIEELKEYIPKQEVYGWDDGVISINTKDGILRTYCTDQVALFIAHEHKNEEGLKEDGILSNTKKDTIVMHDHILHNYNEKYQFENVECLIHLIRRLKKMRENTKHEWCDKLRELLSKANQERNKLIKEKINCFSEEYLNELTKSYDKIMEEAKEVNDEDTNNYFFKEEMNFIKDLEKYKKHYLLWAYRFDIPSTNNNSERNIRPVKSKMKISGQFKNIETAKYYARIRSYIETCKKNGINIIDACVRLMNNKPYSLNEILQYKKD